MNKRLPHIKKKPISIFWNGKSVVGCEGDSIAATLYGADVRTLTKSRKFHDNRGLSGTFTAGHLTSVEGRPHCRLDRTIATQGQHIEMENVWPSINFDILNAAKLLPRKKIRAGFEHPRIIPDGTFIWKLWEKFLWTMAGETNPPKRESITTISGSQIKIDTLIIGGGPSGIESAKQAKGTTLLVTRSEFLGGMAFDSTIEHFDLPDTVKVLTGYEIYALYENARIAMAAPNDSSAPAILIEAKEIILATGQYSVPPLVPGVTVPGVLDARTGLHLAARYGVPPGNKILVAGSNKGRAIAERLIALGCNVIDFIEASSIERILGHRSISGVVTKGRTIKCDCLIHAGPWRTDPALPFQASADGDLRLVAGESPSHVHKVGACNEEDEDITFGPALNRDSLVCPCMDVTVDEVIDLIDQNITHVEELKRRTTCGMGTCQGVPCWDYLAAVIAHVSGKPIHEIGHPSYRPPRAAITFGQAAGLVDVTEVET